MGQNAVWVCRRYLEERERERGREGGRKGLCALYLLSSPLI